MRRKGKLFILLAILAIMIVCMPMIISLLGYLNAYYLIFQIRLHKKNDDAMPYAKLLAQTHTGIDACIDEYSSLWSSRTGTWLEWAIKNARDKDYAVEQLRKSVANKHASFRDIIPHLLLLWNITNNEKYLKKAYRLSCQLVGQVNTKYFLFSVESTLLMLTKSKEGDRLIRKKFEENKLWQMDPNEFVKLMSMKMVQADTLN